MAKVKNINVSFSFKRNMDNYQSMYSSASIDIELDEGDKVNEEYNKAWEIVKAQVKEQLFSKKDGEV